MLKKRFFLLCCIVICCIPARCSAYHQHQVFFQNTEYELNVYRIYGENPGKTLLIIGGIQGNEPGGYLAADLYVEMSLKKGNLIVVPRANFYSILKNVRGVNGDMNRKFATVALGDRDEAIIKQLKKLIRESDFLLNLHDGSGFYDDKWKSDLRNPNRYGQSIIADCDTFYSKKYDTEFNLADMASDICQKVNRKIDNSKHHFHFNNHRTFEKNTPHAEQRKSATYFAVTQHEIPAFGIETSKQLPSAKQRVRYQSMVINAFMDLFGIVQENPNIALPDPEIKFIFAAINDRPPIVVYNRGVIRLTKGDSLTILHAEANYERGLSANIVGFGSYNDMRKKIPITRDTDIIVKKDNLTCGKVHIAVDSAPMSASGKQTLVRYLILDVNRMKVAVAPGERLTVDRGAILMIKDLVTVPADMRSMKVNFKGFVGNRIRNDGEDRGYSINTGRGLLRRFSKNKKGNIYTIVVTNNGDNAAEFYIELKNGKHNRTLKKSK